MAALRRLRLLTNVTIVLCLTFAAASLAPRAAADDEDLSLAVEATVNRAIEGDSLDVHIDGQRVAVGYADVETPDPGQPCGPEALERNRQLAGNHVLLIEGAAEQLDGRGRRLFRAYSADGGSIAETLVREGLGRAVREAPGADHLIALEEAARATGLGCLWG